LQVDQTLDLRLVARALGLPPGRHGGEVQQGQGDGGAGDAVDHRVVLGLEAATEIWPYADDAATAIATDRDLDQRGSPAKQPMEGSGGAVTQQCAWSAGEDRGHPAALATERPPADGADAGMDLVQPPGPLHAVDLVPREAERPKLPARDGAMLRQDDRLQVRAAGSSWLICRAARHVIQLDLHGPSLPGPSCHGTRGSQRNSDLTPDR
jgi:hypothetical protein